MRLFYWFVRRLPRACKHISLYCSCFCQNSSEKSLSDQLASSCRLKASRSYLILLIPSYICLLHEDFTPWWLCRVTHKVCAANALIFNGYSFESSIVIIFVKNLGLLKKWSLFFLNADALLKKTNAFKKNWSIISFSFGDGGVRFSSQNKTRSNNLLWIYLV